MKFIKINPKKVLRYICYSLLTFALGLFAVFLVVIYTSWGSKKVIDIASHYSGGELKVDEISGAIADNLKLKKLSFKNESSSIELEQVVFNWEWTKIFSGEISISRFELQKLGVHLEEQTKQPSPLRKNQEPNDLSEIMNIDLGLLLSLKLRQFSISDSYLKYGEQTYSIDSVQLDSSLEDSVVQIDIENADAQIQQQPLYLKTSLKLDTSGDVPTLNGNFTWSTQIEADQFSGSGTIIGDFSRLKLNHNLTKPWQIDTDVVLGIANNLKPYYSAVTKWGKLDYPVGNPEVVSGESLIKVDGNNMGLEFSVISNVNYQQTPFEIDSSGKFDWKTLRLNKLDVISHDKFSTSLSGKIELEQDIKWDLESQSTVNGIDKTVPQIQKEQLKPKAEITGIYNQKTGLVESKIILTEEELFSRDFSTVANIKYANNNLVTDIFIESPYKLKANFQYDVSDNIFEVHALWAQLFWPVKEWQTMSYNKQGIIDSNHVAMGDVVLSDKGKLHIKGSAEQYNISAHIKTAIENIDASLMLKGEGSANRFEIVNSNINSSIGGILTTGNVSWGEQIEWGAVLIASQLNLETFGMTKSDIGLGVKVTGRYADNATNLVANISEIKGSIGEEQLKGYGQVDIKQDASKIDIKTKVDLNLGETLAKLNAVGSQAEDDIVVDGDYKINIKSMAQLVPGAKGKALVSGKIYTDKKGYHALGDGSLSEFKITGFHCEQGDVEYKVSAQYLDDFINSMQAEVTGIFLNLRTGDTKLKQAKVTAGGDIAGHHLKLDLFGDYNANVVLNGSLDKAYNWKAELNQLDIENEMIGRWSSAAVPIDLQDSTLNLSGFCLNGRRKLNDEYKSTPEKICVDGTFSESLIKAKIIIKQLDMLRFKNILPPDIGVYGLLSGDISAEVKGMDFLNARISSHVESEKGILQLTLIDKKKTDLPYQLLIDSNIYKRKGEFKSGIKINGDLDGGVNAQFQLPNKSADISKTKLTSNMHLQMKNFEWVDEIWPEFQSVKANLNVYATANGTLDDLSYDGSANITEGQLSILLAGIELKDINSTVDFNTEKIVFNGYARSGDGKISISGDANKQNIYPVNIDILGDNFRVADTYEAKVDISPLLAIKLEEDKAKLDGGINIDTARIRVGDLPDSAVSVSDDVNIIKPEGQDQAKPYETEANIKLNLGDNFTFKGFGLTTKLTGGLSIKQQKGLREGFGELELVEGKFKKLGIKLDVEKGQLIFVGPLDNPALNIKAARKLERAKRDEKVSVMIKGTIKNPRLVFPEESTYGQTNTMSNLVTGKSVGEKSDDAATKNQALYSVGLSAGGRFKDQIQDELGLDSFEVTAAGWMLGKYLTPDMYVSYTTKWLQNETQLKLRYNLNRLFTLEAKSGDQQGADIFYTLEKE